MPEDTEFVILTKANYDRQQKDIQFELIDYKSRCEKASEELKQAYTDIQNNENANYIHIAFRNDLLNILQGENNGN